MSRTKSPLTNVCNSLSQSRWRTLRCENLEERRLLAADITFDADTGLVTIDGTDSLDVAKAEIIDGMLHVSIRTQGETIDRSFEESEIVAIYFTGHDGDDRFENSTSISSTARGGDGDDRLTGGSGSDRLYGDDGMDLLRAGDGDDRLYGGNSDDILLGEAGDDQLDGGSRRDLLIGGTGSDRLDGGNWGDILIGGTTSHDDSSGRLYRIRNTWRSGDSYETRLFDISTNSSAALLVNQTVHDDAAADEIIGGSGTDWSFLPGEFNEEVNVDHIAFLKSVDTIEEIESDETVSSVIPHADDTSKLTEHVLFLGLVTRHDATNVAIASGDWSASSTWEDGNVPDDNSNVFVPTGVEVTVDRVIKDRLRNVRVEGTLQYSATADSELLVDTLIVSPEGSFEMGTKDQPLPSDVTARLMIVDNGEIDREWDRLELSRGAIIHGTAEIHGAEKTAFMALDGAARRGDRTLILKEAPSNWQVGDQLVLAGTDRYGKQNEELEIESIDGNRISLSSSLRYNHDSPRADLSAHVANLSRNAIIESESDGEVRGHLMFMHSDSVDINYVAIHDLGRTDKSIPTNDSLLDDNFRLISESGTNQRGRYAMHFHRAGSHGHTHIHADGQEHIHGGAKVHGSVVTGSRGWGYVNHSSNVDFTSNVAYDVTDAAFVTESGDEIGRFDGNISIFSRGSGENTESRREIEDFGHQGNGFWFQGGGVSVVNNIASGHDEDGFIFFTRGLREGGESRIRFATENLLDASIANGRASISVGEVPIREFKNNESYANETGFATRFHKLGESHEQVSVIEGLRMWNNRRGMNLPYTNNVIVRDVEIIGTPERPEGYGITRNSVTRNVTYENVTVEGYEYGLQVPNRGVNNIVSGRFNNINNIVIETAVRDRTVHIHDAVDFEVPSNLRGKTPYEIYLRSEIEPRNESSDHLFYDDQIFVYDSFGRRQIYFHEQAASFIPFPEQQEFVPDEYVGKSNEELWNEFGKAIAGQISPPNAAEIDSIFGGVIDRIIGDANNDGKFDSSDLVAVFQAGEYEDGIAGNSDWAEGDWSGDGDFDTSDLVLAFQSGRYIDA